MRHQVTSYDIALGNYHKPNQYVIIVVIVIIDQLSCLASSVAVPVVMADAAQC